MARSGINLMRHGMRWDRIGAILERGRRSGELTRRPCHTNLQSSGRV